MLADPHPAVGAAVAVWARLALVGARFDAWLARIPIGAEFGEMPRQADVDIRTAERTGGLVDRFPLELTDRVAVVLASVLATEITWDRPFAVVPARQLGGPLGRKRQRASQADLAHDQFLADTAAAGLVAVHAVSGGGGLQVVSVIAAPPVPLARVLAAAGQAAAFLTGDDRHARQVSLFDMALGAGHDWDFTEARVEEGSPAEVFITVLPAWSVRTDVDLAGMPGIEEGFAAMQSLLRPDVPPLGAVARQCVAATFRRKGFAAAAATAIGQAALAIPSSRPLTTQRTAMVRFNRPYAVVAVCRGGPPGAAWDGVPVFSAWIAAADEAESE